MTGRPEARDLNVRSDRQPETRGGSLNIPSIFDGGEERLKFRLGAKNSGCPVAQNSSRFVLAARRVISASFFRSPLRIVNDSA